MSRSRLARLLAPLAGVTLFAACTDSTTAPRLTPAAPARASASVGSCSAAPAQAVRVTQDAVTLLVGAQTTVTACTQFAGDYTVRLASQTPITPGTSVIALAPTGTVSPVRPAVDAPFAAALQITAVSPGTATVTVTDRKGNVATVVVTVPAIGPVTFRATSPLVAPGSVGFLYVPIAQAGYAGPFMLTGCTSTYTCIGFPPRYSCVTPGNAVGGELEIAIGQTASGYVLTATSKREQFVDALDCTVTVQGGGGQSASFTFHITPVS